MRNAIIALSFVSIFAAAHAAPASNATPFEQKLAACQSINMDPTMKPEADGCIVAAVDRELAACARIGMDPTMKPEADGCELVVRERAAKFQ